MYISFVCKILNDPQKISYLVVNMSDDEVFQILSYNLMKLNRTSVYYRKHKFYFHLTLNYRYSKFTI